MKKKIAFLFPGQGAQYVGMGKDFCDNFAAARAVFQEADELLSSNFSRLIFEGPQEELTLTKNSQLAIYIVSIALLRTLNKECPEIEPTVCAGLSLGEYTALTAAGKISFKEGLFLVQARGAYMHEACEKSPGSLRVVLGMEPEAVEKALASSKDVWVANLNCPGQVVIAGTHRGLDAAEAVLKAQGAKRVLPLDVSGAFHSPLMQSARDKLAPLIQEVPLAITETSVVMNVPGDYVTSNEEIRSCMIAQVTSPVRWEKGIRAIDARGIDLFIEIGCGKTLAGMNKKIGVQAPTINIEKVADLEGVLCNC